MKTSFLSGLAVCVIVLFAASCNNEEFFELTSPEVQQWQTLDEFENGVVGAYYAISGNGGYRTIFASRLAGELFADGFQLASPSAGFNVSADAEDMYNRTVDGNTEIGIFNNHTFRSGYFGVGFANGGLDRINDAGGVPFPEEGADATDRQEGELLFIRSYAYFNLVRIYCPAFPNDEKRLPFRREQADNFDEAITSELASANDIYALMVDDLSRAVTLLPERYDPDLHPLAYADGRANRFAASALLAKVLFQMGRFDEALTQLNYVIDQNGGDYDMSEDPIDAWNKTGIARGKEVIWYYALWTGDGLGGSSNWKHPRRLEWINLSDQNDSGPENNNNRFMPTSDAFLQQTGWTDGSNNETAAALEDKRYVQLFARLEEDPNSRFTPGRPYVWGHKYYRAGRRLTNLPLIRLGEMHLMRAIIRADLGTTTDREGAIADLNTVRTRAGLPAYQDGQDLAEAIHLEHFKEMSAEGERLYYLQATDQPLPSGDRGGSPVDAKGPFYSGVPEFERELNAAYKQ